MQTNLHYQPKVALAIYRPAHHTAKISKPHIIVEDLILLTAVDMLN